MRRTQIVYDGSFEGLLTAIFQIYIHKIEMVSIMRAGDDTINLFDEKIIIHTDENESERVFTGLEKWLNKSAISKLVKVYLSELRGSEDLILRFVQKTFKCKKNMMGDFSDPDVLAISKIIKSVHRERHRMEAFVRFKLTKDHIYWANVEPDFNVLPLVMTHFKKRYADQKWIIYDIKREYGIYYDLDKIETVEFDFNDPFNPLNTSDEIFDTEEKNFQKLWRTYFDSSNIKSRKNTKLHVQHVPKRYWKYLIEKIA